MTQTEFFNTPISVVGAMDGEGQLTLQSLTWQGQKYTVIATGRQWDEKEGRRLMVEAADGTRFEIELRREDLIWYVRKVWRGAIMV